MTPLLLVRELYFSVDKLCVDTIKVLAVPHAYPWPMQSLKKVIIIIRPRYHPLPEQCFDQVDDDVQWTSPSTWSKQSTWSSSLCSRCGIKSPRSYLVKIWLFVGDLPPSPSHQLDPEHIAPHLRHYNHDHHRHYNHHHHQNHNDQHCCHCRCRCDRKYWHNFDPNGMRQFHSLWLNDWIIYVFKAKNNIHC